jgi:hypothetical protein
MRKAQDRAAFAFDRRAVLKASVAIAIIPGIAGAKGTEVALAGMAYTGDAVSLSTRFPYSIAYEEKLKKTGSPVYARLLDSLKGAPPRNFDLVPTIDDLRGRDQALAVALVISSETVSLEKFGDLVKLLVLIRGQTMFFDFKSKAVVRSYPLSFAYIDSVTHVPDEQEIAERVRLVYEGANGKPGILSRFTNSVTSSTLPNPATRSLQVSSVTIRPDALAILPPYLVSSPLVTQTWAADLVGEDLSTRTGVPITPYAKGYAIGNVMSMRVSDGEVFNLKFPEPDYEIHVEFTKFKKVEFGKSGAGASFIYGGFASIKIVEPLGGKVYLNAELKNGETKMVPITQTYVDDFPAFYDAINGLFVKLAEAIDGRGNNWVKSASAAPDIEKQISDTRELFKQCK